LFLFFGLLVANGFVSFSQSVEAIFPEAAFSFYAVDLNTNETLIDVNSHKWMEPASLLKIVTTASALKILGPDYKFKTEFYVKGEIVNDILNGALIIKAGGDPTLGSSYFRTSLPEIFLAETKKKLEDAGIKGLNGKLIIDISELPMPEYPSSRLWEDMSNYYGASPSALSWRDNSFTITLSSPSQPGLLCRVVSTSIPNIELNFDCYVTASSINRDSAYVYGYPGLPDWYITGSIPAGTDAFVIKAAMPFPEKVFAHEFLSLFEHLQNVNVVVEQHPVDVSLAKRIWVWKSEPLSEIIRVINNKSLNLSADHLFLAMAGDDSASPMRWDKAGLALNNFWLKHHISEPVRLLDGSGLSKGNRVSAYYMVEVLKLMNGESEADIFKQSLPISGESGTLRYMWQTKPYRGEIQAKSGSMTGVVNYAGYLTTHTQRKVAFCIMLNNVNASSSVIKKEIELVIARFIDKH
jgi:D-alanyl-D-alanine carboxypeptidase/D-alanyl-D-alanine-endopeptidase (penicillin-binding protein 4)